MSLKPNLLKIKFSKSEMTNWNLKEQLMKFYRWQILKDENEKAFQFKLGAIIHTAQQVIAFIPVAESLLKQDIIKKFGAI